MLIAVREGNQKSIEILLNKLVLCLFIGNENVVTVLIRNRADVNTKNKRGYTPLAIAVSTGDLKCPKPKLEHGTLSHFYFAGNTRIADILIQNGANLEKVGEHGWTPLHFAARFGNTSILKFKKKLLNEANKSISRSGYKAVMDLLIKNGANVDALTADGLTPLLLLVDSGIFK